jgi:hypothetical protein
MKKIVFVCLTVILSLSIVLAMAGPALACIPGKSPGYWKNHEEAWPTCFAIDPDATLLSIFGIGPTGALGTTLMEALQTGKNSALFKREDAQFWRQLVATLLNQDCDPDEVEFLRQLAQTVYPAGGGSFTPSGLPWPGPFGASDWDLEDWKDWLEGFNNL